MEWWFGREHKTPTQFSGCVFSLVFLCLFADKVCMFVVVWVSECSVCLSVCRPFCFMGCRHTHYLAVFYLVYLDTFCERFSINTFCRFMLPLNYIYHLNCGVNHRNNDCLRCSCDCVSNLNRENVFVSLWNRQRPTTNSIMFRVNECSFFNNNNTRPPKPPPTNIDSHTHTHAPHTKSPILASSQQRRRCTNSNTEDNNIFYTDTYDRRITSYRK